MNTLYVDKSLKHHGLIQAYSRTNRILGEQKSQGNILAFRNLKAAADEAITLFSNKEAIEDIILPAYEAIVKKFSDALDELLSITPEEQLDQEQFKALIDVYIFSGLDPLRDDVLRCLGNRTSILKACEIGERIIAKMKEYVDVFEKGMVA